MLSFITSLFSGSYTPGSTMSVFGTDNSIAYNPPELKIEDVKACLAFAADREHKLRVA